MAINYPEGTQDLPALICQADVAAAAGVYSTNSTSWTTISGFSNAIATKKTNSAILVIITLGALTGQGNTHAFRLARNGIAIAMGAPSSNHETHSFRVEGANGTVNTNHCHGQTWMYVDSPGVSANSTLTYSLSCRSEQGPMYINRSVSDGNDSNVYNGRSHSSIILLEIA